MAKKVLTQAKHLQARGLFALAHHHYQKSRDAESALADLLGYDDVYCDCLSDELYGDGNFDKGMEREGFTVLPAKKTARR